ncbi:MAG: ribosomal-protein-alanine N-acetyltransferase [Firmicutes bacterium]|nr:ribosomal-protein-alanine N-acetyltransferase [Bacillota bacterium]
MIEQVLVTNNNLSEIEESFPQVLWKNCLKESLINNKFTKYFTYKIDNQIVAFINYSIMYERAELIDIYVLDRYRNQKIATTLLEYMINDCHQENVTSITLEVKVTNTNAISLYKKFNFEEISIRKGYYEGIDGILMRKELIQ